MPTREEKINKLVRRAMNALNNYVDLDATSKVGQDNRKKCEEFIRGGFSKVSDADLENPFLVNAMVREFIQANPDAQIVAVILPKVENNLVTVAQEVLNVFSQHMAESIIELFKYDQKAGKFVGLQLNENDLKKFANQCFNKLYNELYSTYDSSANIVGDIQEKIDFYISRIYQELENKNNTTFNLKLPDVDSIVRLLVPRQRFKGKPFKPELPKIDEGNQDEDIEAYTGRYQRSSPPPITFVRGGHDFGSFSASEIKPVNRSFRNEASEAAAAAAAERIKKFLEQRNNQVGLQKNAPHPIRELRDIVRSLVKDDDSHQKRPKN